MEVLENLKKQKFWGLFNKQDFQLKQNCRKTGNPKRLRSWAEAKRLRVNLCTHPNLHPSIKAQHLAVKSNLTGFYETRVFLEESKVWMDRIINMESKYFDTTKEYFEKRDEVYK